MRLLPANGAYPAQLADDVYATDPNAAGVLLQKAVDLNAYDAGSWIQLGLLHEANNDLAAAEAALERAAGADATFLPAWSLANFYFRRQNEPQFWHWAQRAAHMAPDDASPLFRLAWYVTPSVPVIENRLQLQRPAIQSQFVAFLIAQGNPQAVSEAAAHLLQAGQPGSTQTILGACEWLIAARHPELALSLWNSLAAHRQIAYPPLTLATADTVTNGNFLRQPVSQGFDWHLGTAEGVSTFLNTNPNALGFEFSGDEPDQFELVSQLAPVEAQKQYALLVRYESNGIPSGNGLMWTVRDDRTGAVLAHTASLSAPQGGQAVACFAVPANSHFIHLALEYQRQPGTLHPEGKLALAQVRLAAATGQACGQ